VYKTHHPRENSSFRETDAEYRNRLYEFKHILSQSKARTDKTREYLKRRYEEKKKKN
jgi:phosphohistidine phosphatase SixA